METATPTSLGTWEPTPGGRRLAVRQHAWLSRVEWLDEVGSTNDVVMGWLSDGIAEVCVGIAEEQTSGRGRNGRTWTAPAGSALLASIGFTPTWLPPEQAWKLAGIVSLAMAEAGEDVTHAPRGSIRLKWPNDLVLDDRATGVTRKLAGVLGETAELPDRGRVAVIGIGVNAGWARADFPAEIADGMTSLGELAASAEGSGKAVGGEALNGEMLGDGEAHVDREALVETFLQHLAPLVDLLRSGVFPAAEWQSRQLTSRRLVRIEWPDGTSETVSAVDVDPESGALLIREPGGDEAPRPVHVGEIRHVRVGGVV
jgi:BirA family transcriptional regulator, biotin operon repressor / biotin---[acetyl-CoA-carboxylase] ligase